MIFIGSNTSKQLILLLGQKQAHIIYVTGSKTSLLSVTVLKTCLWFLLVQKQAHNLLLGQKQVWFLSGQKQAHN